MREAWVQRGGGGLRLKPLQTLRSFEVVGSFPQHLIKLLIEPNLEPSQRIKGDLDLSYQGGTWTFHIKGGPKF